MMKAVAAPAPPAIQHQAFGKAALQHGAVPIGPVDDVGFEEVLDLPHMVGAVPGAVDAFDRDEICGPCAGGGPDDLAGFAPGQADLYDEALPGVGIGLASKLAQSPARPCCARRWASAISAPAAANC